MPPKKTRKMRIRFLGTSAGWPLPRLGCKCEICTSADPKDRRTRTQLLIDDTLLLDIGIDTYFHLSGAGVDPTKIKYAAITHEHPDHTFGLWDLAHTYLSTQEGKSGPRNKVKIITHPLTFSKLRSLFFPGEYEVLKTQADRVIRINSLEVKLLPVNHTNSSFGILVSRDNKRLFYAPDMKSLSSETFAKIGGIDLLAFDGSELKIKTPPHQTIEEGIELAKNLKAKKVYFVHLGHRTLPHRKLEQFVKEKGGKKFNISFDNLEVSL